VTFPVFVSISPGGQDHAETENVGAMIDRQSSDLLRRHLADGAHHQARIVLIARVSVESGAD
jgi:hypothetical protein